MIQTPSNTEPGTSYLVKCTHTRIIICPLNLKIDFEKNFEDFFFARN